MDGEAIAIEHSFPRYPSPPLPYPCHTCSVAIIITTIRRQSNSQGRQRVYHLKGGGDGFNPRNELQ